VLASELDSARQERDVLREQLQNTQLTLDSLRIEMTVSVQLLLLLILLLLLLGGLVTISVAVRTLDL